MSNDSTRRRLGSIRELPSGRVFARITSGVKADGTPRVVSKTLDTRAEAESWLISKSVELSRELSRPAGVTLRVLWDAYKEHRSGRLARKTYNSYKWHMEGAETRRESANHVPWVDCMGDTEVSRITPSIVQRHLSTMPAQKARHAKTALSSVLSWGAREGLLERNPLHGHRFAYADEERGGDAFDVDPFAAIEGTRDVWDVSTALRCFDMIRGLPLEPAWLACVGAGLRVEEALALRGMDVRRIDVGGRMLTQLAVHAATTDADARKSTKTRQSVRIASMVEPFGERYWEIAREVGRVDRVCPVSAKNQNKRWRSYFSAPKTHKRMAESRKVSGRLASLPYVPLSKMRNTHVSIMAEVGVSDATNALMHGHTEMVERRHYLSPDTTSATIAATERFRLIV